MITFSRINFFLAIIFCVKISIAQQGVYHPLRITETITLDGKLDENIWQQAEIENDFMQTDPAPGDSATEKTEVRILYNDEFLYAGFRCYDREPSKILRLKLERDYSIGEDDGTGFIIDTYHDKYTGVCFISNTLDARWDGQVTSDGSNQEDSYNTFWDVATNMDSLGYTTEYRIPWSSLRFETKPEITMAFRATRLIYRKNELVTYPRMDSSISDGWCNISYAKEMVFEGLKSRKPFYISPYVIADYSMQNLLNAAGTAYEKNEQFMTRKYYSNNEIIDKIISNIGADAKYGLSKNLTLDLTVNTDFAQAEVDDIIINLTKYGVNLPEKRSFFLESANNLTFSFPSGNELFTTRNIGNENDVIVPIITGARVTGKESGWQLGVLDMQTKGVADVDVSPHNQFVLRTRKDIDKLGSFAGGIFTNRINTDSTNTSNQSIGVSALKRLNTHVSVLAGAAGTLNNFDFSSFAKSMYYSAGIFRSASEGLNYGTYIDLVGKEFNPEMGYLDEANHGLVNADGTYKFKASAASKVQYWEWNSNASYRWILSEGRRETFYAEVNPGIAFKNGSGIVVSLFKYKIDTLFYDWYLNEQNAISAGTYKMWNTAASYWTPSGYNFNAGIDASYGGFYGGKRFFISPQGHYNINRHFAIELQYEYNRIAFNKFLEVEQSTLYTTNLVRLKFAYLISTKLSIKLYTQFDDLNHSISGNLRFRYNPREGTDLYVVMNQGLNTELDQFDPHLPRTDSREITVKFVRTFGL